MPGYDRHVGAAKRVAMLAAPLVATITYVVTEDPWLAAIGLFGSGLVVVGGMAPDLDSNSSIPRRRLVSIVHGLLVLSIGAVLGRYWEQLVLAVEELLAGAGEIPIPPELIVLSVGGGAVVLVLTKTGGVIQAVLPAHRGLFHQLPFWVAVGAVLGGGLFAAGSVASVTRPVRLYAALVLPALLVLGVSVHLYQDGEII